MNYVDWKWQPYSRLRFDKNTKQQQTRQLYPTGLCEGPNGAEFCFVPTTEIKRLEQKINEMHPSISIENHEVAICNEIFHTSKIEGADTTYLRTQELYRGEPINEENYFSDKMVLGGFIATQFLNLYDNRLDESILLTMWNILVDEACQNEDIRGIKYRIGNVGIGNHMGIHFEYIEEAVKYWIDYYNSDTLNDHPFIKAALLYYVFEYIHPFCDGNGRAGRLLMTNYLIGQGIEVCKAVSFSRSIEKNRATYDNAFAVSENAYFDVTPFIEYMLSIYVDAFYDALYLEKEESTDRDAIQNEERI